MAITAADLEAWLSVATPEDDTSTSGGIIQDDAHASGGLKPEFTDISATGTVAVLSDGADTRTVTVYGRLASGAIDYEDIVLSGTSPQTGAKSFERILKATLSAKDASRTVTVRKSSDSVTIGTMEPNVLGFRRMFYDAESSGSEENRYELVYLKNAHGTLTLNSAYVSLDNDPATNLTIGVADAKGTATSRTDRTTAPTEIVASTWYDDTSLVAVPTGGLAAGERIGVWLKQTLAAGASAFKNTWRLKLEGTTAP